ncbi:hypothetical protein [Gorillibacterium sp. CAU 1737]|uniref:hypothetical protein n=1 Tax=Gorillibacterium sp. CAU 1737 TaxID=3140362 RepID=UPI0032605E44
MSGIAWAIIACEVAFWLFIGAGLVTRYAFKMEKAGLVLLAMTPVIDVLLLLLTGIDLYGGATATAAHGIAAVYIGVSLLFGRDMIRWADKRYQVFILRKGALPPKRYGREHSMQELRTFLKHVAAFLVAAGLIWGLTLIMDDASRTSGLAGVTQIWSVVLLIDFVITATYLVWPKKRPQA